MCMGKRSFCGTLHSTGKPKSQEEEVGGASVLLRLLEEPSIAWRAVSLDFCTCASDALNSFVLVVLGSFASTLRVRQPPVFPAALLLPVFFPWWRR